MSIGKPYQGGGIYCQKKKEIRNLTQLDDDYLQHENETEGDKGSFKKKGNKKCYSRLTEYMSNPPLVPPQFITPSSAQRTMFVLNKANTNNKRKVMIIYQNYEYNSGDAGLELCREGF